jgi:hypothetical protein
MTDNVILEAAQITSTTPKVTIIQSSLEKGIAAKVLQSLYLFYFQFIRKVICDQVRLNKQQDIAEQIKRKCDESSEINLSRGKGPWHCIVGTSFAAGVDHERGYSLMADIPALGSTVRTERGFVAWYQP